ncbi:MAG TPA: TIGR03668 family PPOX class F420-dependent oxidoreductase [Ktedonobacteraceae bacterium]|nr:TIGR03668 family PPOX class F420-dependent oxidoreductase [Ktedonobacteraceae bacterium]
MAGRATLTAQEAQFVQGQRVGHLATSDEEGHPYVVPICYAFDGERFYTPLDEKPKRVEANRLRRVRNIEARHEAALVIDQYAEDWSQLGYVLVQGRADLLAPDDALHAHALRLLRERYPQYRNMNLETKRVIVITPARVTSWGPVMEK